MKPRSDNEFAAFVGIDWADAKHDICLQAADSEQRELKERSGARPSSRRTEGMKLIL